MVGESAHAGSHPCEAINAAAALSSARRASSVVGCCVNHIEKPILNNLGKNLSNLTPAQKAAFKECLKQVTELLREVGISEDVRNA